MLFISYLSSRGVHFFSYLLFYFNSISKIVVHYFQFFFYNAYFLCFSCRDTLIYATSVEATGMKDAVEVLSEVVLRPMITEEEVRNFFLSFFFFPINIWE